MLCITGDTLPRSAIPGLDISPDLHEAELTGYLDWLYGALTFRQWFAGHFHVDQQIREDLRVLLNEAVIL